ncbi:MAG: AsmA family protein [Verrucomicrobiota bacterium]|jgi:hypothetical protein|nr:AsmA family protein [Verrucomicrobiota bacterium]
MKKFGKFLIGLVVGIVVLLVLAVVTLPLTIAPLVKTAASVGGPKVLGVPVSVGDVKLRPLAGELLISHVRIGNPEGYSQKDAFSVAKIEVSLNVASLLSDTIVVRKVSIDAPSILYEKKGGKSNFDVMLANASVAEQKEKTASPKDKSSSKKVVIDEVVLSGAKVAYSSGLTLGQAVTLPLPSVTVRDIGKASGGASLVEAVTQILTGLLSSVTDLVSTVAGATGDLIKGAGGAAGNLIKGAGGVAGDLIKGAGNAAGSAVKGASDAAKGAADGIKKLFK